MVRDTTTPRPHSLRLPWGNCRQRKFGPRVRIDDFESECGHFVFLRSTHRTLFAWAVPVFIDGFGRTKVLDLVFFVERERVVRRLWISVSWVVCSRAAEQRYRTSVGGVQPPQEKRQPRVLSTPTTASNPNCGAFVLCAPGHRHSYIRLFRPCRC